ncbi:MAG: tetratricopeptide repeat protein [Anaerolineales bacterium]|nr:tetratricopeptide repeat protein [Anaerolineales bacterium]
MTVVLTKVRAPQRRKDTLRRVRLTDALHQNLYRKLTFVSAPAGFGKTTLLTDFVGDVDALVCWYSISPDDIDLAPFMQHLVAAFSQNIPNFGEHILEQLNTTAGAIDPRSMAVELLNEIETKIDDFCILVLDDYHLVGENREIVNLLEAILDFLPDQVRMVIGSRSVYGIPTANLYVREELAVLGAEQLRFRAEELQDLVKQNYRFELSDQRAKDLAERADGWIVAILLAIRNMEQGGIPKFEGATDQVYTFLAEEVVSSQPEHLRQFLYETAILDEFDEQVCQFVLEQSSVAELLNELESRNLFVSRIVTQDGRSYRYHQLFAEFLRDQLAKIDPERKQVLHRRAAAWYREHDAWEMAIRHMLAAGERIEAAAWMDKLANQLFVTGHQTTLSQWYEALNQPTDIRVHAPRLILNRAKTLVNQSAFESGEELLDIAESALKQNGDVEQVANVSVTRGIIRLYQGKFSDALQLADQAQGLLSEHFNGKAESYQWFQAERLKGLTNIYKGNSAQAITHLQAAAVHFRDLMNAADKNQALKPANDLAMALTDMGFVHIHNGQIFDAQKCFVEALEIREKTKTNQGELAISRNNVAYLYHQIGHYQQAWVEYERALEAVKYAQWLRIMANILNGRGDLLRDIEEWKEAEDAYTQAREIGESNNDEPNLGDTYNGLAELERLRGNYNDALYWLREAARLRGEDLETPRYQLSVGAIYQNMGQMDLAEEAFAKSLAALEKVEQIQKDHVLARFLMGRICFEKGEKVQAIEMLSQALQGAASLGFDQFLVVAGREAPKYLEYAVKKLPNRQLASITERVKNFETGSSQLRPKKARVEAPSKHLEIQAMGTGQVRINGELIPNSEWRSNGARALFFYIVDKRGARKEDIGLEFWPEFSTAKISSNFHATLWRVRRALDSKDMIVFEDNLYNLNPSLSIWYDVADFESALQRANSEDLSINERAELWRRAINLYRTDYLEDIFMDWANLRRTELQNAYLQALASLAEWEIDTQHFTEAIRWLEKITAVDPYQDHFHLMIMECLVQSGSPSAAKAHYQDYSKLLKKELDIEPTDELREYYEQIT